MPHLPAPAFAHTAGPKPAKLLLLGEAWGATEADTGEPFAGESGKELFRMLGEAMPHVAPEAHVQACSDMRYGNSWLQSRRAWLTAAGIAMTNVLAIRPAGNKIESLCSSKKDLPSDYSLPAITHGHYLQPTYLSELDRLHSEISGFAPNLIIALGNTACWATLQSTNIGSIRGTIARVGGVKVLPTYHPSGVLRQWAWRPIVVADLMKAAREAEFAEIRRPEREILVNPTLDEVRRWTHDTLATPPAILASDIETGAGQIKCIGFARSRSESIVIPFVDLAKPGGSYWSTVEEEFQAWECTRALLESPIPKVGQNFIYDLQYICRNTPIRPKALVHDTMLLHHSLWPEMQKGLGFLGSIYTNEASWKLMRLRKPDTEKRDE